MAETLILSLCASWVILGDFSGFRGLSGRSCQRSVRSQWSGHSGRVVHAEERLLGASADAIARSGDVKPPGLVGCQRSERAFQGYDRL